jgi:hypothetical protein
MEGTMTYRPDALYCVRGILCIWTRGVFHRLETGTFVAYDWEVVGEVEEIALSG